MTTPIKHLLENLSRVAPFGLRFWDQVSGSIIIDGLIVNAYPADNPDHRTKAFTNRLGIYIFRNLPGLHEFEFGTGNKEFWDDFSIKRPFVIEVNDSENRFLPFNFSVELPVKGLFNLESLLLGSPPNGGNFIPLFSTPSRAIPGALAVVRAELWDITEGKPAAWSVLEIWADGLSPIKGLADEKGRVAIIFPYPEPASDTSGSPPGAIKPLHEENWKINLQLYYSSKNADLRIPDLYKIMQKNPATILSVLSPPTPLKEVILEYGKELIIKSQLKSILFILPN